MPRTTCQLDSGSLLCRRANEEGEGFRDVACGQAAVLRVLIVLGPEGVKLPDHVLSKQVEISRVVVWDAQWKGRSHSKGMGEMGKREKQRISVSKRYARVTLGNQGVCKRPQSRRCNWIVRC